MLWAFPSDFGDASKIAQDIDSDDHALARVRKIAATGEANVLDAQTHSSVHDGSHARDRWAEHALKSENE